jgi:hypothetical protein
VSLGLGLQLSLLTWGVGTLDRTKKKSPEIGHGEIKQDLEDGVLGIVSEEPAQLFSLAVLLVGQLTKAGPGLCYSGLIC